jgi:hypothetical protein
MSNCVAPDTCYQVADVNTETTGVFRQPNHCFCCGDARSKPCIFTVTMPTGSKCNSGFVFDTSSIYKNFYELAVATMPPGVAEKCGADEGIYTFSAPWEVGTAATCAPPPKTEVNSCCNIPSIPVTLLSLKISLLVETPSAQLVSKLVSSLFLSAVSAVKCYNASICWVACVILSLYLSLPD